MDNNEIIRLLKQAKDVSKEKNEGNSLPSNCFYLKNGNILALRNPNGDSRYPYSVDGLTLWAYASGNISINQSNFFVIPPSIEGKEPYINFYGGIKNNKNKYDVISLTGNADSDIGLNLKTYVIFNPAYCYFIKEHKNIIFAVKMTVSKNKKIVFSTTAINRGKKDVDTFISFYFNPLLTHSSFEDEETKWFRTVELKQNNAYFTSVEDLSREVHLNNYGVLKIANNGDKIDVVSRREDYTGDKNRSISQSINLKNGFFVNHLSKASFVDMAIYGDIVQKNLKTNQSIISNYEFAICFEETEYNELINQEYDIDSNDKIFEEIKNNKPDIKINFGKINDYPLNNELFNHFLSSVIDQVTYGSKTKNSSLMLLGIRDVYQMLEASLIWDKENARKKIIESISYLDPSGRAPRQYAKETVGRSPLLDNREFIDQGQWIISTIHKYLAFTNDYSILKEKCCYYKLIDKRSGQKLEQYDSVYNHLTKIINYLISNIDSDTHCLKTLYGDWNDAVDGLGASKNDKFGNGISIMATCHLYKNLYEMEDIRKIVKDRNNPNYLAIAKEIEKGILTNGVVEQNGVRKIVHGWGENRSFYVGSFKDVDNISRYSSTSHAFFVISGLYENNKGFHDDILKAAEALDSKYGIMTFDHYFAKNNAYKVGRIVNLPKGTAENGATYIHAGMFFARALLIMKEGKLGFDQIYKLIPITHNFISTSPYVMPNSYGYNKDLGIDGESMSDWYTGSSNTLLKAIIFDMFGINPLIGDELIINPTNYFPSENAEISLNIKKKKIHVKYINKHSSKREIFVNNELVINNRINLKSYKNKIEIQIID